MSELAAVGFSLFKKATDFLKSSHNELRADSYIEFTKPTRVEPICLVDSAATTLPGLADVLQSMQSQFTGYYLQAVSCIATVGEVQVLNTLGKLSPDRDLVGAAVGLSMSLLSLENYKDRLPMVRKTTALEAEGGAAAIPKDAMTAAKEISNLSVGKLINVTISNNGKSLTLPVSIRLIVTSVPSNNLIHIFTNDNHDKTATERKFGWSSGRLAFIRDIIFCQDLIDRYREMRIKDKDGAYSAMMARSNRNFLTALVTKNPSVATASNLLVMLDTTARDMELQGGFRLDNFRDREAFFKRTTLMIIAVIDPGLERVTFYHRSIPQETDLGIRDLKNSNKGDGPNIDDILKAYNLGTNPRL